MSAQEIFGLLLGYQWAASTEGLASQDLRLAMNICHLPRSKSLTRIQLQFDEHFHHWVKKNIPSQSLQNKHPKNTNFGQWCPGHASFNGHHCNSPHFGSGPLRLGQVETRDQSGTYSGVSERLEGRYQEMNKTSGFLIQFFFFFPQYVSPATTQSGPSVAIRSQMAEQLSSIGCFEGFLKHHEHFSWILHHLVYLASSWTNSQASEQTASVLGKSCWTSAAWLAMRSHESEVDLEGQEDHLEELLGLDHGNFLIGF